MGASTLQARTVVGVHGAGLTNLAWCAPGTGVLEIISSAHPMPHFRTLADAQGLRYGCVVGESIPPPDGVRMAAQLLDVRVDATAFAAALEAIVALESAECGPLPG